VAASHCHGRHRSNEPSTYVIKLTCDGKLPASSYADDTQSHAKTRKPLSLESKGVRANSVASAQDFTVWAHLLQRNAKTKKPRPPASVELYQFDGRRRASKGALCFPHVRRSTDSSQTLVAARHFEAWPCPAPSDYSHTFDGRLHLPAKGRRFVFREKALAYIRKKRRRQTRAFREYLRASSEQASRHHKDVELCLRGHHSEGLQISCTLERASQGCADKAYDACEATNPQSGTTMKAGFSSVKARKPFMISRHEEFVLLSHIDCGPNFPARTLLRLHRQKFAHVLLPNAEFQAFFR
jgi:hypothetical protein